MMRARALILAGLLGAAGCGDTPLTPAQQQPVSLTPTSGPGPAVVFSGLDTHEAPISSYSEAGYTVTASGGAWKASTKYGNPSPFVQFATPAGQTTEGQLDVTAGGAAFTFTSVDLYASVIPIPYRITGLRNGAVVFAIDDRLPNTFGKFMTVTNPGAASPIDTLRILLINAASPCCGNPMGVDNLIFGQ